MFNDPTIGLWGKDKMTKKLKWSLKDSHSKRQIKALLNDTYALQRHRVMNLSMKKNFIVI